MATKEKTPQEYYDNLMPSSKRQKRGDDEEETQREGEWERDGHPSYSHHPHHHIEGVPDSPTPGSLPNHNKSKFGSIPEEGFSFFPPPRAHTHLDHRPGSSKASSFTAPLPPPRDSKEIGGGPSVSPSKSPVKSSGSPKKKKVQPKRIVPEQTDILRHGGFAPINMTTKSASPLDESWRENGILVHQKFGLGHEHSHHASHTNLHSVSSSRKGALYPNTPMTPTRATPSSFFNDDYDEECCLLLQNLPSIEPRFKIDSIIGSGTFSTVFKGILKTPKPLEGHVLALKKIVSSCDPPRIEREIACLHELRGSPNVVQLMGIMREKDDAILLLEYFEHNKFQDYYLDMSVDEIRKYMHGLFLAVGAIHEKGFIHRDIKPTNFLYNRKAGRFLLVDFGLAQTRSDPNVSEVAMKVPHTSGGGEGPIKVRSGLDPRPSITFDPAKGPVHSQPHSLGVAGLLRDDKRRVQKASRGGTRGFRALEVLLKCPVQTPAIDIWSAGVVFLCLLSGRFPFFQSFDDLDGVAEIISIFGEAKVKEAAEQLGKELLTGNGGIPQESIEDLTHLCERLREGNAKPSDYRLDVPLAAYDLLRQTLALHPADRVSAKDALKHEFFAPLHS